MAATEAPKRKPGRPKGTPRTGGRKPGTPNRTSQVGRDYIVRNGTPIEVLCKIARGIKMLAAADTASAAKRAAVYPTVDQRLAAARILAAKIVPDMRAVEHTGAAGEPLSVRINLGA